MAVLATFTRMYVNDLDLGIDALAACGVSGVRLRFAHASGLQLALVDSVLVLAGPNEVLQPFRTTDLTVIVDDIEEAVESAQAGGGVVSRDLAEQAVGRNITLTFPAGPIVEFVQWTQETRSAAGM